MKRLLGHLGLVFGALLVALGCSTSPGNATGQVSSGRDPSPTSATPLQRDPSPRGVRGVVAIDVIDNRVTPVYEGAAEFIRVTFSHDQESVWVSDNASGSWRVNVEGGQAAERVNAVRVIDSPSEARVLVRPEGEPGARLETPGGELTLLSGGLCSFAPTASHLACAGFDQMILVEMQTLEQVEVHELESCHCDTDVTPQWSPSGRYFTFFDFNPLSAFVFDVRNLTATPLPELGVPNSMAISWSPSSDVLAVRGEETVELIDISTGQRRTILEVGPLVVSGPSALAFDPSGAYIYWHERGSFGDLTVVASTDSLQRLREIDGLATVVGTSTGYRVASRNASACTGVLTGVYGALPNLHEDEMCIEDAVDAVWSPQGELLAIERSGGARTISVLNPASDEETVVAEVIGYSGLQWSAEGRYLLTFEARGP